MSSLASLVLLLGAGMLAGALGTAGAITSLVSYPALLLAGLSPLDAGITNIVAASAMLPSAALASGPELAGRGRWLGRHGLVAAAGGAVGTGLLLATPAGAFAAIVPFLVLAGSLALLASPWLTALRAGAGGSAGSRTGGDGALFDGGVLAGSVYNGYFGAGSGVMLLALCLVLVDGSLPVANAVKNMLVGAASVTAAVLLALLGSVAWGDAVPLGIGLFAGGLLGPGLARRIPASVLRPLVAAVGAGLAVQLWLTHGA